MFVKSLIDYAEQLTLIETVYLAPSEIKWFEILLTLRLTHFKVVLAPI